MAAEFELERDFLGPLVFSGERLAAVSTFAAHKRYWSEFSIYRTDGGNYVTEVLGQTNDPSKETLRNVKIHSSADNAVRSFIRDGNLSGPAQRLLDEAAEEDEDIAEVLDSLESSPERLD